jgi:excisionase family DNA binding protein
VIARSSIDVSEGNLMAIQLSTPTRETPSRSLLRISEVAERLRVGRSTVYLLLHHDTPLRVCHIGRAIRIEASSVDAYIEQLADRSEA